MYVADFLYCFFNVPPPETIWGHIVFALSVYLCVGLFEDNPSIGHNF